MADSLTARANVGAGTDQLAVDNVPGGAAGVVKVALGAPGVVDSYLGQSPLPVSGTVNVDTSSALFVDVQNQVNVAAIDTTVTASLAALNAAATLSADGMTSIGVQVAGTYIGTIIFEGTLNGTNWVTISGIAVSNGAVVSTLASAAQGVWQLSAASYASIRARMSAFTSGTANVTMRGSKFGPEAIAIDNPIPAGANTIGAVTISGTPSVALAAGTNLAGDVGLQVRATATGAATSLKILSAATTNAAIVKASAGRLYGYQVMNNGVATAYIKLHNVATLPVAGTTAVATIIAIPPANTATWSCPQGVAFTAGIGITIVGGAADNDVMPVGANQVCGHLAFA